MPKQIKIAIIVAISLAVLAAVIAGIVAFVGKDDSTNTNTTSNENSNASGTLPNVNNSEFNTNTNGNSNTNDDILPEEQNEQELVVRISRIFVERYGSYSNRSNFENITRLEPFMTEALKKKSAEYVSENATQNSTDEYYGISTTANAPELVEFVADDSATVRVGTRRIETSSTQDQRTFTQYAIVGLKSVSGTWKVNTIEWEQ